MNYIKIKVKRFYFVNGVKVASVRDYQIQKALKENKSVIIQCSGEKKELCREELLQLKPSSKLMKSKFKNTSYRLMDVAWNKPNCYEEGLLSGLAK